MASVDFVVGDDGQGFPIRSSSMKLSSSAQQFARREQPRPTARISTHEVRRHKSLAERRRLADAEFMAAWAWEPPLPRGDALAACRSALAVVLGPPTPVALKPHHPFLVYDESGIAHARASRASKPKPTVSESETFLI